VAHSEPASTRGLLRLIDRDFNVDQHFNPERKALLHPSLHPPFQYAEKKTGPKISGRHTT
jgi:hypothetical protein